MTLRVQFRTKAERDILTAARYYETKSESLGLQFLERIDDIVDLIRDHPKMFPVCLGSFRRAVLKQFPHALYYEIENHVIVVGAVLHQHREITNMGDLS